ncbi:MAG: hypothetical protein ABSA12_01235 [Verrucomicrobiia bacterium]
MSDEEHYLHAHKTAAEVSQKFDYYLTGLVGVVLAYCIQHYTPRNYDSFVALIEPFALFLLAGSFWFSYKRLSIAFLQSSIGFHRVAEQYRITTLLEALQKFPNGAEDADTGFRSAEDMRAEIKLRRQNLTTQSKQLEPLERASDRAYRYRFILFACGLVFLLIAKIAAPAIPVKPLQVEIVPVSTDKH